MLTRRQMLMASHHPGWSDGRKGYLWCRFDAIICPVNHLRAELTWADDSDKQADGLAKHYYDPRLQLECNLKIGDEYKRTRAVELMPSDDGTALLLVTMPPHKLLSYYLYEWTGPLGCSHQLVEQLYNYLEATHVAL